MEGHILGILRYAAFQKKGEKSQLRWRHIPSVRSLYACSLNQFFSLLFSSPLVHHFHIASVILTRPFWTYACFTAEEQISPSSPVLKMKRCKVLHKWISKAVGLKGISTDKEYRIKMRRILLTNEAWRWGLLSGRNHPIRTICAWLQPFLK